MIDKNMPNRNWPENRFSSHIRANL